MAKKFSKPAPANRNAKKANTGSAGKADGWDKATKAFDKKWAKARTDKGGFSDEPPEIDDGTYFAQATGASCGVISSNGVPFVSIRFAILKGDFKGLQPSKFCRLTNPDDDEDTRGMMFFARTINNLGYNAEELSLADIKDLCSEIGKDKPFCQIAIKNSNKNGKRYQEVYVNKQLDENGDEVE